MAENLASGNSINFVFDADDYISITGNATVIATGPTTSVNTSTTGTATFGPYPRGASVRIIATGDLTYTLTRPRGVDTPMYFDQERGLLSGDAAGAVIATQAKRSNIGMRIEAGRAQTVFDNATQKTFRDLQSTAQGFDAVQLVFSACNAVSITVGPVHVRSLVNSAAFDTAAAGTQVLFGGAASGVIPARASATRRSYLVSDIVVLGSVDRTDGFTGALLESSAYVQTSGSLTLKGAGADSWTNWATKPDGRIRISRYADGDCVTTPANFSNTTNRSTSVVIGVIYYARGRVVNVAGFGDSMTDGRGTYLGAGWGFEACQRLSDPTKTVYEWSNLAWSASNSPQISLMVEDAIAAGLPIHAAFMMTMSHNDFAGAGSISDSELALTRSYAARSIGLLTKANIAVIPWTVMPSNPPGGTPAGAKNYAADDAKRRLRAAEILAWNTKGFVVADFNGALVSAGATIDGTGQTNFPPGTSTDGNHLTDGGNALIIPEAMRAIRGVAS